MPCAGREPGSLENCCAGSRKATAAWGQHGGTWYTTARTRFSVLGTLEGKPLKGLRSWVIGSCLYFETVFMGDTERGKYNMICPSQNDLCTISIPFQRLPFCTSAARARWASDRTLTKSLALCDFQLWKDAFCKLNISLPGGTQILGVFVFILALPQTTSILFIRHRVKGSENHEHLANQPSGKHVLGSFSADL